MWGLKVLLSGGRRILSVSYELNPRRRFLRYWNKPPYASIQATKAQCQLSRIQFLTTESGNSAGGEGKEWSSKDGAEAEPEKKTDEEIKKEILDFALNYVCDHGWTRESLSLGAQEAGYAGVAEGMFDKGGVDLLMHLIDSNDMDLNNYMKSIQKDEVGEKMKVSEFIKDTLEQRLRMIIPYIGVWPDAMAILLQPQNIADSTRSLSHMVDDIWFQAGDTATDFSWYTKRAMLAKLYVSTQTVMINDQSSDFDDTWKFLSRRLNDIATFSRTSRNIQNAGQMAFDVMFATTTVLKNVVGIGNTRR